MARLSGQSRVGSRKDATASYIGAGVAAPVGQKPGVLVGAVSATSSTMAEMTRRMFLTGSVAAMSAASAALGFAVMLTGSVAAQSSAAGAITQGGGAPAEIAWTPAMMGGIWLSSTQPTSITKPDGTQATVAGDQVNQFNDLGPTANHLRARANTDAAPASGNYPLLGTDARRIQKDATFYRPITFNSGVQTHRLNTTTAVTTIAGAFSVMQLARHRPAATAVQRAAIGASTGNFDGLLQTSTVRGAGRVELAGAGSAAPMEVDANERIELYSIRRLGTGLGYEGRMNGESALATAASGLNSTGLKQIIVGNVWSGSQGAEMDLFDQVIVPGENISRANEARYEGWCWHTYGYPNLAGTGHTYELAPPMVPAGTTSTAGTISARQAASQTWLGPQIELQSADYNGEGLIDPQNAGWGFPLSLTTSERARFKARYFPAGGKGIRYIRLPLGFAYRGGRVVDAGTGLIKQFGPKYAGENEALIDLLSNVVAAGGGLWPEYWSPAPYFKTFDANAQAAGATGPTMGYGDLSAGGAYANTVTLESIRVSDPTQYAARITEFTNSIINDLEYLHTTVAPVKGFNLQNEAGNTIESGFGTCIYTDALYSDVMRVLIPKIRASATLNASGNYVRIGAESWWGVQAPGDCGYTLRSEPSVWAQIDDLFVHRIASHRTDADYAKTLANSGGKPLNQNEFHYFNSADTADWRMANTALKTANYIAVHGAVTDCIIIHGGKRFSDNTVDSDATGYGLTLFREPGSATPAAPYASVGVGEYVENNVNAYAVQAYADNIKCPAVIRKMEGTFITAGRQAFAFTDADGKYGFMLVNRNATSWTADVDVYKTRNMAGKRYTFAGGAVNTTPVAGIKVPVAVPAYGIEVWVEQ